MVLSHSTKCISFGLLRCTFWAQMLYPLSVKLLLRPGDFLLCVIYRPPTSCNLEGNFHFFLEFWMREVSLSSLSLKKRGFESVGAWMGERGEGGWSQNLECAGRKSQKWGYLNSPPSLTSLLLCFLLLLFSDKGEKRDDGARNKQELLDV